MSRLMDDEQAMLYPMTDWPKELFQACFHTALSHPRDYFVLLATLSAASFINFGLFVAIVPFTFLGISS